MKRMGDLHPNDVREIRTFERFLKLGVRPDEGRRIFREFPGWTFYVIGRPFFGPSDRSLAPPVGYDSTPVTAWTFPG